MQALWFAFPVIAAGFVHIAVIKADLLAPLARLPLDGGLTIRQRRVFGPNKTVRGLVVMTTAAALLAALQSLCVQLAPDLAAFSVFGPPTQHAGSWGALLGAGYVLGELPNSFVKRRLDIAAGARAAGRLGPAFWLLDQVDSLVGVLVAARIWGPVPPSLAGTLLIITLVVHPLAAWSMVRLGLKNRIG